MPQHLIKTIQVMGWELPLATPFSFDYLKKTGDFFD